MLLLNYQHSRLRAGGYGLRGLWTLVLCELLPLISFLRTTSLSSSSIFLLLTLPKTEEKKSTSMFYVPTGFRGFVEISKNPWNQSTYPLKIYIFPGIGQEPTSDLPLLGEKDLPTWKNEKGESWEMKRRAVWHILSSEAGNSGAWTLAQWGLLQ